MIIDPTNIAIALALSAGLFGLAAAWEAHECARKRDNDE